MRELNLILLGPPGAGKGTRTQRGVRSEVHRNIRAAVATLRLEEEL